MSLDAEPDDLIRPISKPGKKYLIVGALATVGFLIFAAAYTYQLMNGLAVTNLSDWGSGGGVTWGLYIGSFVWWVGIAHGGILVSAAARLFELEKYEPVARIAELLTIGALSMAGLMIVVHLGRPDRMVWSTVRAYPTTVHTSPLAWDLTVITLYFVMTATYLSLTLRSDIYQLRDKLPDILSPVYSAVLFRYDPDEDPVVERMAWWLSLGIIVLAPLLLHGGVIPWLFQLTPSMPNWYGGLTAPQFLSAALTSAMGGVMFVAYIFRVVYDWEDVLPDEVFHGLGWWMGLFGLLWLWFQLQKLITGAYAPTRDVEPVVNTMLHSNLYMLALGLVAVPLAYVAFQHFGILDFSVRGTVIAGIGVILAVLLDKTLFVVEGLIYASTRLYENVPGAYVPTPIELASLVGTVSMIVLFFLTISKLVPIVELKAVKEHETEPEGGD